MLLFEYNIIKNMQVDKNVIQIKFEASNNKKNKIKLFKTMLFMSKIWN